VYHSKVEGYKEAAACKGSDRAYQFGMQPDKEITLKIAGEIQGGRGITLSCIHAGNFREKKMETNLDMLHPNTYLFLFGTRMCIACPHFPGATLGAKSICQTVEREIKETMKEGNGYRSILFAWELGGRRDIRCWCLDREEAVLSICRHGVVLPHSELPQLMLWSTATMEHMRTLSHIAMTSGNSVLLWFLRGARAGRQLPCLSLDGCHCQAAICS
jgi:hypothetical protein